MESTTRGNVVVRGGGILSKKRPVFTTDGKFLLVCSGQKVKIFSCTSGQCVRELRGHKSKVTGVQISPWNKLQVLTSSEDGTILLWDYMDNVILKTITFDRPLHGLFLNESHKNTVFVICKKINAQGEIKSKKSWMLSSAPIPSTPTNETPIRPEYLTPMTFMGGKGVSFGVNGEYVACLMGQKLRVYSFKDQTVQRIILNSPRPTCLACHPQEYCIAVGNVKGQISMVWNFLQGDAAVQAVDHWHALALEDICYSPEGSYLFSGGHECTLVQWQHNSKHRDFMPRLGAPITHIACSPNGQMRALCMKNNSILLVSTKVLHTIQGIDHSSFNQTQSDPVPTGLAVDPRTGSLVMNGRVGHLQFYKLGDDRLLYNLDITSENYISPENLDKPLTHTEITHVTFDPRGDWMVTAERRDDGETSVEMRLKFWEFDAKKQSFTLNTTVETPHQDVINSLSFRPSDRTSGDPMAVTTSRDGKFKIWALVDDTDIEKSKSCWNCESVGFYKNTEPRAATFSSDGSLLGVGFHEVITLWDPEVNELRKTLSHAAISSQITCMCFGHGGSSHLLVCSTSSSLAVWNMLTCRVAWSVNLAVNKLIADPYTEHFAVFDTKQNLFVFRGSDPQPILHQLPASKSEVISAVFTPRHDQGAGSAQQDALPWQHQSELYFLTKSQELLTVIGREEAKREEGTSRYDMTDLHDSLPQTPFAQLLGGSSRLNSLDDGPRTGQSQHVASGSATTKEILAAPPHILPPASHLCSSFIRCLLGSANEHSRNEESDSENEGDSDDGRPGHASSDSDMETDAVATPRTTGNQSGEPTGSHHLQAANEVLELSEKEMKRLKKAARTGLNWLSQAAGDS